MKIAVLVGFLTYQEIAYITMRWPYTLVSFLPSHATVDVILIIGVFLLVWIDELVMFALNVER